MYADPHGTGFVLEEINIVVARPDSPKLGARHLLEIRNAGFVPQWTVEEIVIDALFVGAADAEADRFGNVGKDRADLILDRRVGRVEPDRHVSAGDVESDAADGDVVGISDDTAD